MSDHKSPLEGVEPMSPLDPDHEGESQARPDPADDDGVGVAPDLTDPLKRQPDDKQPGLDPVVPVVPSD